MFIAIINIWRGGRSLKYKRNCSLSTLLLEINFLELCSVNTHEQQRMSNFIKMLFVLKVNEECSLQEEIIFGFHWATDVLKSTPVVWLSAITFLTGVCRNKFSRSLKVVKIQEDSISERRVFLWVNFISMSYTELFATSSSGFLFLCIFITFPLQIVV